MQLETGNWKLETGDWRLETGDWRLETGDWRLETALLTITRTDPADVQQRQVIVTLDGQRFGQLMFGETLTQEIPPGPHRLRISNTLVWKTAAFDATPGERIRFDVVNRAGRLTYPLMLVMGAGPLYLTVRRVAEG